MTTTPHDRLEEILRQPGTWPQLSDDELADVLRLACVRHALGADSDGSHVDELYEHVVETLTPEARLRVVLATGHWLEGYGRRHGAGLPGALLPFITRDPDSGVVSAAALEAAQSFGPVGGDLLQGPRELLALACGTEEESRQAAILGGLTAFGDARVFGLIEAEWERLSEVVHARLIESISDQPPTVAAVEFMVGRLEQWIAAGDEGPIGFVVRALVRLAHIAGDANAGSYFAGAGVKDTERVFPSWAVAADGVPIRVRATHTVTEMGGRIGPRLSLLATGESYPRLLPAAMRAWDVEDRPFVDALRTALQGSGVEAEYSGLLDGPVSVQPLPDWDRKDCLLEWGVLNDFGPTKVQLSLVPVGDEVRALVYAAHNPHSPVCFLLGTIWGDDLTTCLAEILTTLPGFFELGGRPPLSPLPHWVRVPEEAAVDVAPNGVTFFRALNAFDVARGIASEPDITEEIDRVERLRRDPAQEVASQIKDAMTAKKEALAGGDATSASAAVLSRRVDRRATTDEWERWFRAASAPDHVSAVAQHFLDCWSATARLLESRQT